MALAPSVLNVFSVLRRLAAALATFAIALPSAQAALITYHASLGPEAQGATGSGFVTLVFDDVANALSIQAQWSGLTGTTTVAHIHCCTATPLTGTAGVAVTPTTLPGFPTGVTGGSYSRIIDLTQTSSFTGGFLTAGGGTTAGATALLLSGLNSGRAYFNIHSTVFPGGEIRGFPRFVVPEPGTLALLSMALICAALASGVRRRRAGRAPDRH